MCPLSASFIRPVEDQIVALPRAFAMRIECVVDSYLSSRPRAVHISGDITFQLFIVCVCVCWGEYVGIHALVRL